MTSGYARMRRPGLLVCLLAVLALVGECGVGTASESPPIDSSGVRGGLAVWVGGDVAPAEWARDLHGLHDTQGFLVLGLHSDAQVVAETRAELVRLGEYGAVSVDTLGSQADQTLPMIDNSVNLLVVSSQYQVSRQEILRVLAPLGTALAQGSWNQETRKRGGAGWSKIIKPWPEEIDEWTHYLHDPSNNAVAHDERIGPPKRLQWQCGPRWSRHHDHMASMSALVSARGRVFYILDEGSRVSPQLPSDWKLIARDAFNGVFLWERAIDKWHDHLWPLKSGPANLPRRLVAVGETLYVTLGLEAPVTALDAASGETQREYANTAGAEEILLKDGTLLVLVNRTPFDLNVDLADDPEEGKSRDHRTTYSPTMGRIWAGVRSRRWTHGDRVVRAFDEESGRLLWERAGRVIPLTLAADGDNVYFHDGDKIVALDVLTGKDQWASEPIPVWQGLEGRGLQSWFAPTLVACEGKVLFAGGEKIHMSYVGWGSKDIGQDTMTVLSAKTGEKLWTAAHPYSGYNSPEDLFVANGKVWTGTTGKGGPDGRYTSHDLRTGEMDKDLPPTVETFWFHHRCYRARATDKYILSSRTGIEFIDLETGKWDINHWVRGGCLYGIMPCNGMVYAPPHPCACYPEAKLYGFAALAGGSRAQSPGSRAEKRLMLGPAADQALDPSPSTLDPNSDWPTYRHDAARSGATASEVSAKLQAQWQTELGGRLTQPVAASGRLFVADVDRHVVHAIDTESGKSLWNYVAGGRIDSPPTYDRGRVLFGSANGYVYCLRASDGVLAWRFRAASLDRRMVAFDQVESVWPVHGSVLVQDGVASFVAGRSMYLDGGLRFCQLDAETGRLLGEKILDGRDPETNEDLQGRVKGLNMPVALPDILSSDEGYLYMRSQVMDLEGNRLTLGPAKSGRDHLFAPYGFTDDTWFHRTYWVFGDNFQGGVGGFGTGRKIPAGRILANNETTIFGYGRKPDYYRWSSVIDYQLFATVKPGGDSGMPQAVKPKNLVVSKQGRGKSAVPYLWTRDVPMMVRAMALAGNTLLIAGPVDAVDEDAAFQSFQDKTTQKQLAAQDAALKGKTGAIFQTVNAKTGETTAEYRLDSPPVFDGLIVAAGRVFIATMDGRLLAFAKPTTASRPDNPHNP